MDLADGTRLLLLSTMALNTEQLGNFLPLLAQPIYPGMVKAVRRRRISSCLVILQISILLIELNALISSIKIMVDCRYSKRCSSTLQFIQSLCIHLWYESSSAISLERGRFFSEISISNRLISSIIIILLLYAIYSFSSGLEEYWFAPVIWC